MFDIGARTGDEIAAAYEACDYSRAMRLIMGLADTANGYIDARRPWELAKQSASDPEASRQLQDVCSVALNLFRQLAIYLAPVLPKLAQQTGELLGDPIVSWDQSQQPLLGRPVGKFTHMMQRVDPKNVAAMQAAAAEPAEAEPTAEAAPGDSDAALLAEPIAQTISFEEFAKVDLRVARVIAAEDVPGAKAPKAHARSWRRQPSHGVCRHQGRVQAGGPGRTAGDLCRQLGSAEDEVRHQRRYDRCRRRWRRRNLPARSGLGRQAGTKGTLMERDEG